MNLILQTIPSPLVSELLADSRFDGVIIDTEHGYFNHETLYSCIQVITLNRKKCFVRFTDLNKQLVRMCLDAGIDGAIFSTVEDSETGKSILEYCKYPTHGGKRGCGLVRENKWGKKPLGESQPMLVAQIETKKAIDNIDDILQCDFDLFLIGPYDISSSLGVPAQWDNEVYLNYVDRIYDKVALDKLGLFFPTDKDLELFRTLKKSRPTLLVLGIDTDFILKGLDNIKI